MLKLASNSWESSCISLLSAGFTDITPHLAHASLQIEIRVFNTLTPDPAVGEERSPWVLMFPGDMKICAKLVTVSPGEPLIFRV